MARMYMHCIFSTLLSLECREICLIKVQKWLLHGVFSAFMQYDKENLKFCKVIRKTGFPI